MFKILYFGILLSLFPVYAYAYLDPGSGSILLYIIISIVSAVTYSGKSLWYIITYFFRKGKKNDNISNTKFDLIFHIEGSQYANTFLPVLSSLNESLGLKVLILYQGDIQRPEELDHLIWSKYNNETDLLLATNRAQGKVLVSTTPNLNVYMLRRSKDVLHYSYLFHAPTDVAFYEKHALDSYDSVHCVGPFQKKSIRYLENKRKTKKKKLYASGCPYYDVLVKSDKLTSKTKPTTLLYAPSWGQRCSLNTFGLELLDILNELNIPVVMRPHPQLYISDSNLMQKVEEKIKFLDNISISESVSPLKSFDESILLISDISGIIFDYAFLKKRPIILLDSQVDLNFYEAGDLSEVWDLQARSEIGQVVQPEEKNKLKSYIKKAMNQSRENEIQSFIDNEIYNYSLAGPQIAKDLEELAQSDLGDVL